MCVCYIGEQERIPGGTDNTFASLTEPHTMSCECRNIATWTTQNPELLTTWRPNTQWRIRPKAQASIKIWVRRWCHELRWRYRDDLLLMTTANARRWTNQNAQALRKVPLGLLRASSASQHERGCKHTHQSINCFWIARCLLRCWVETWSSFSASDASSLFFLAPEKADERWNDITRQTVFVQGSFCLALALLIQN